MPWPSLKNGSAFWGFSLGWSCMWTMGGRTGKSLMAQYMARPETTQAATMPTMDRRMNSALMEGAASGWSTTSVEMAPASRRAAAASASSSS